MHVQALPEFRTHGGDKKFVALTQADICESAHLRQYINFLSAWLPDSLAGLRVLDFGCGRGEFVGALRQRGVQAFGVEIDPRFVASGYLLQEMYPEDIPILSLIDERGRTAFPDEYFDVVISDQVLEHVANLDVVASEISRVLRPGGRMCHLFPARLRVVEPHYKFPLIHWIPKGPVRKFAFKSLLAMGMGKQFFTSYTLSERTNILYTYSVEETFYRRVSEIAQAFEEHGLSSSFREGMKVYIRSRIGRPIPDWVPFITLVSTFRIVMFTGGKR